MKKHWKSVTKVDIIHFYTKPGNDTLHSCLFHLSDNLNYDTKSKGSNGLVRGQD